MGSATFLFFLTCSRQEGGGDTRVLGYNVTDGNSGTYFPPNVHQQSKFNAQQPQGIWHGPILPQVVLSLKTWCEAEVPASFSRVSASANFFEISESFSDVPYVKLGS